MKRFFASKLFVAPAILLLMGITFRAPNLIGAYCKNLAFVRLSHSVSKAEELRPFDTWFSESILVNTATLNSVVNTIKVCSRWVSSCDRDRMLGVVAALQGELQVAEDLLGSADALDKMHPMVQYYQAYAWEQEGRQALLDGDIGTALKKFALADKAIPFLGYLHSKHYQEFCIEQYRTGQFAEAEMACQQSMTVKPNKYAALYLGVANLRMGSLPLAEENLRIANGYDESWPEPYFWLGELYSSRQNYSQAESNYLLALHYDPQNRDSHWRLVSLYMQLGEPESAISHLIFLSESENSTISDKAKANRLLEEIRGTHQ